MGAHNHPQTAWLAPKEGSMGNRRKEKGRSRQRRRVVGQKQAGQEFAIFDRPLKFLTEFRQMDSCKFPMEQIIGAQSFNFASKFPKIGLFRSNFCIL